MSSPIDDWLRGIIRVNAKREWTLGRYYFTYERRSKSNAMGRFGGGWDWNLGFQAGSSELILNLLVSSLRVRKMPACASCRQWVNNSLYKKRDGEWRNYHRECWEEINE